MKSFLSALLITLLFASPQALAGDAAAGKAKSVVCSACHGADGTSVNPQWPNLKGQKEEYLIKQIKACSVLRFAVNKAPNCHFTKPEFNSGFFSAYIPQNFLLMTR
jgi:hypothetical protein